MKTTQTMTLTAMMLTTCNNDADDGDNASLADNDDADNDDADNDNANYDACENGVDTMTLTMTPMTTTMLTITTLMTKTPLTTETLIRTHRWPIGLVHLAFVESGRFRRFK